MCLLCAVPCVRVCVRGEAIVVRVDLRSEMDLTD